MSFLPDPVGRRFALVAGWIVLCVIPSGLIADTIEQRRGCAMLEVRFMPSVPKTAQIALSDTITVTLKIEGSAGWKITAPRQLPSSAPWIQDGEAITSQETLGSGRRLWQRVYRLAPREPGTLPLEFPEVRVQQDDTPAHPINWDPIPFTVATRIAQPDRAGLRENVDIEKLVEPAEVETNELWWLSIAFVPVLAVLFFLLARFFRRRQARTPVQRALYEWRRLQKMKLPEQGQPEQFITLLSLLLRDYLQRDLDLKARRQTTAELQASLTSTTILTNDQKQFLVEFLSCADAVKFAQVIPSIDECSRWNARTCQFLQERGSDKQTGQAPVVFPIEKFSQTG